MGRLTSAVHWWEESQMRVLVLGNLVIQFLLYIFSFLRRRAIPGWIRFLMWLAYLGGDAIAIYALATLFNHHKDQDRGSKSTLQVVWAPILLIHLGGHDGITAYNIEDNELWSRHLLTAVSQVTVAIYVFSKSWPPGGDERLLQAAILLFVPGVLKCFAKPWALKRASIKSLVSSPSAEGTTGQTKEDMKRLEKYVQRRAKASVREQKDEGKQNEGEMDTFERYVKGAMAFVREQKDEGEALQVYPRAPVEDSDHRPSQQGDDISSSQDHRQVKEKEWDLDMILHGKQNEGEMDTFERYVKGAMAFVTEPKDDGEANNDISSTQDHRQHKLDLIWAFVREQRDDIVRISQIKEEERDLNMILHGEAYKLFVDLSSPYPLRLSVFKYFWTLSEEGVEKAYDSVRQGLASAFILLYTKRKISGLTTKITKHALLWSLWSYVEKVFKFFLECLKSFKFDEAIMKHLFRILVQFPRVYVPWAAIGLFHHSHREAYSGIDVKITYALLCCTAVLELYSQAVFAYEGIVGEQWPEMVAQYNLIEYFVRSKNHSNMMWIARKSGCKDFLDQHWCMESRFSSGTIAELVLRYLKDGWKKKIQDPVSYHKFNDNRGQWALEGYEDELGWSIKRPFDESVLLWHIATDFCFFLTTPHQAVQCMQMSKQMSNYMVYLLFVNPEMLLPGTKRHLFATAYDELKVILRDNNLNPQSCCCCCQQVVEKEVMETLKNTMQGRSNKEKFIGDAWDLAQGLFKLRDDFGDEKMWKVIQGVWVEMLCFSASRCRGYLHAKALGSGGEFLSYVWLLRFYTGMETFSERLQREELPSREANNIGAPPPSHAHNGSDTASSSTSGRIRSRATPSPSHLHTGASTSNSEIHIANMV